MLIVWRYVEFCLIMWYNITKEIDKSLSVKRRVNVKVALCANVVHFTS